MSSSQWPVVQLSDVAEHCLGKMLDHKKNRGRPLPYLRNPNIRWFEVDSSELLDMRFEESEDERYGLRPGDVLICEGGEAGRAAIWDGRLPHVKFQKAIHRVRVGPNLDARFLVHRLYADYHSGRLSDYYTGATIKHLTGQDLARYRFPLPPIDEQRRIRQILDCADALRTRRRAALAQFEAMTQAIFLEMFGDPVENPRKWTVRKLSDLIDSNRPICYGILMPGADVPGGVKYVRVVDMQGGIIRLATVRRTTPEISNTYKRSLLKTGDLLLSIRGHVGRLATVPNALNCANITQDTARLAIVAANPVYIRECLRTPSFQIWMARHTKGVAVKGMNLSDVKLMPIPLPPDCAQARFEQRAEKISRVLDQQQMSLTQADALFASLQHRAFRGEL